MGRAEFPPCFLNWGQTMVQVMKIMVTFKKSHARTAALSAPEQQQATTDPRLCQRLLDTHRQVWVSLFGGHGSFLLGPGEHKILFVPSKSLFPQPRVSSGSSMAGLMATSSKRAYAIPRSAAPRAPVPVAGHCWPVPPQETLEHFLAQSLWGLWVLVHTRFVWALWVSLVGMEFDSKCDFIPPTILLELPLCPWMWNTFFGGIQYSPAHGCSAASCNFGVLSGEDECTSFYSAIFLRHTHKAVVCRSP